MKKHYNIFVSFLIILTITTSCTQSTSTSQTNEIEYKDLIKEKLGNNVVFTHSANDLYVLAVNETKGTVKQPQNSISYLVYDLKKALIIKEDTFGPGSIKWYDDQRLEIFQLPGIIPEGKTKDDFTYIYDVETKNRVPKANLEEQ